MAKPHTTIPIAYLRECFELDAETGALRWRDRPREHFLSEHDRKAFNTSHAEKRAGALHVQGYLTVGLSFSGKKLNLRAHRIVWALATGAWPHGDVDHWNGVRADNRLGNLREATRSQNNHNSGPHKRNTSGYRGVIWDRSKWQAKIVVGGRVRHLGRFATPEDAFFAYLDGKAKYHPFQPEPRDPNENEAALAAGHWFLRERWREIV